MVEEYPLIITCLNVLYYPSKHLKVDYYWPASSVFSIEVRHCMVVGTFFPISGKHV